MNQLAPRTPTYRSAARVLERRNGEGMRLVGWTLMRTALILPGFMIAGVPMRKAIAGSLISSALISTFAIVFIHQEATCPK